MTSALIRTKMQNGATARIHAGLKRAGLGIEMHEKAPKSKTN
jgi:hypothetical protein